MNINYGETNLPQMAFIGDQENRGILFLAGRGSGKTFAGSIKLLSYALIPDTVHSIIAPTYKQLAVIQDTLWQILWNMQLSPEEKGVLNKFRQRGQPYLVRNYNKKEFDLELICGIGPLKTSTIHFRSGDNPDSLRGYNNSTFWIDEPALMKQEVYDNLILTLRKPLYSDLSMRNPRQKHGAVTNPPLSTNFWLTGTPRGFNWLYDVIHDPGSLITKVYIATTYDNQGNLPPGFVDSLPTEGNWARQEVMGEFVQLEGLVFSGDYQIGDLELNDKAIICGGIDIGGRSPTAVILIAKMGNVYYAFHEIYQRELTSPDLVDMLVGGLDTGGWLPVDLAEPGIRFFSDHDPDLIKQLTRAGIRVVNAKKDIRYGIDVLKSGNLVVSPRCVNLIKELEQYSWDKTGEKPIKGNDHAIDALRYAVVGMQESQPVVTARIAWYDTDPWLWKKQKRF